MKVIVAGRLSQQAAERDQTGFDSQEREAVRWAEAHGHEVVAAVADFKSGRSGLDSRPNLRPWVTDPVYLSRYDAIVTLKIDRLTRGDRAETAKVEAWAREHGKQLVIVEGEVHFPSEGADGIRWDLGLRLAHDEWLRISERYLRMQRTLRERGSLVGRAPWGFSIERAHGVKRLVPTSDGRRYIPEIFARIIRGESLRTVAAWLAAEGVTTMHGGDWHEGTIGMRLVKNPVYYGERRGGGNLETEALVSPTVWHEANAALTTRARYQNMPAPHGKPLLLPVCGHPSCNATGDGPSPMYRVHGGRGASRRAYYRCSGTGAQRRGCGAPMIQAAELDDIVHEAMLSDFTMHRERVFVAGDDHADAIRKLRLALDTATSRSESNALWDQIETLEAQPQSAAYWDLIETPETEAEFYDKLTPDQRRAYLTRKVVRAYKDQIESLVVVSITPR